MISIKLCQASLLNQTMTCVFSCKFAAHFRNTSGVLLLNFWIFSTALTRSLIFSRVRNSFPNFIFQRQGDQWLGKTLKSQEMLSICVGNQSIPALRHALESTTLILFMLCYDKSKRQHKIMPMMFLHTILVCEGF